MFNLATESGYPEIFMRSQETLNIPFKYQSFKSTSEQASSILHAKHENGRVVKKKELSYNIKVKANDTITKIYFAFPNSQFL